LGVAGVLMILAAYVGVQVDRMDARSWGGLALNLAGSMLILASMLTAFNLSAALMEAAWALTALYGLWRRWRG
jgi:hypothetical protein